MLVSRQLFMSALFAMFALNSAANADIVTVQDRLLCPAELVVLRADAERLATATITDAEGRGLRNRIAAALATLPWLCRRYVEVGDNRARVGKTTSASEPTPGAMDATQFLESIRALGKLSDDSERLVTSLEELLQVAPFRIERFHFDKSGNEDENEMAAVYRNYCHGCHSTTNVNGENPAYPLNAMARDRPEAEFFARMLLGVRGTAEIGLSNPLTPMEIGAMTRYLLKFNP